MNILVLTSVFYIPNKSKEYNTKILNYFVSEWASAGHRVFIIYNKSIFPSLYYKLPQRVYNLIESLFSVVIDPQDAKANEFNEVSGSLVLTLPMVKYIPYATYSEKAIKLQASKITDTLQTKQFVPDIILGHWENPQLQLIPILKKFYNCKSSIVLHSPPKNVTEKFIKLISKFDSVGFRNRSMLENTLKLTGRLNNPFVCYSGIPSTFVESLAVSEKVFSNTITKFIFVGNLIKRKFPLTLLLALQKANKPFLLTYVGNGAEKRRLTAYLQEHKIHDQVQLKDRLNRGELVELLKASECFTMISKDEAFGLVYLEAMACGCLVVAAKGEGMDGIIENRVNGFLCEAGNVDELASIYQYLDSLRPEEKKTISNRAIETARRYTDAKVAKYYLDTVCRN